MRAHRSRVTLAMTSLLAATIPAFGQPPVPTPMPLPELQKLEQPEILNRPAWASDPADPTYTRVRNERALFERARSYFDENSYGSAASTLKEFIQLYPRSGLVAEAKYRLSVADSFLGRKDEAVNVQEQLVRDHLASPWARLVLTTHFTHQQLRKLADELRLRGKENRDDALAAAATYKIMLERCAKDISKPEITYLMAVCLELHGSTTEAHGLYGQLAEGEGNDTWGTLARFRTGDAEKFREGMAELANLEANGEEAHAFLELAERFEAGLGDDDFLHCRVLRGKCLARLHRDEQAVSVWWTTLAEAPRSPWAPECLFWLAEHHYRHKNIARAAEEYRLLLRNYPGSARAAVARRRAEALPSYDDNWAELERLVTAVGVKLAVNQPTFSAKLTCTRRGEEVFRARLAYQDRSHCLAEAALGDKEFLLLANDEGGWFRLPDEPSVRTTPHGGLFPLPRVQLSFDPATGDHHFSFASVDGTDGVLFEIAPDYVASALSEIQQDMHLRRLVRTVSGEKRVVFQLESASSDSVDPNTWEIEVDAAGNIRTISVSGMDRGKLVGCSLFDIRVGEALPPGTFAAHLPPGIERREVESISMVDLIPTFAKLIPLIYRGSANSKDTGSRIE